jgi:hypothetical protein
MKILQSLPVNFTGSKKKILKLVGVDLLVKAGIID